MHTLNFIRLNVLHCSVSEMGRIAGVHRQTVKRWIESESEPDFNHLVAIRNAIIDRQIPFNDEWFFQQPFYIHKRVYKDA